MDGKENAECGDVAVRDKDDERKQFYGKIVADYRETAQYRKIGVGHKCSLCISATANCVLYPCRHCCICQTCARQEHILVDSKTNLVSSSSTICTAAMPATSGTICPVCAKGVQVLIQARPFSDGTYEDAEYHKWTHEGDPPMPPGFASRLQESGIILKLKANNGVHKTSFDEAAESCICTTF